ncbi:hypothetical protein J7M23_00995 [Candidatus Sumerlaeota bacterium]|nr:hypothetical protein [Candidatus Sumerlaeota bacterium]
MLERKSTHILNLKYTLAGIVIALGVMWGCQHQTSTIIDRKYLPPHTLSTIIAELKIYQSADIYRFPYPRTPAGQNVFKATLRRLDNFERLYPELAGEFKDIIDFSRALAFEKLGEIDKADKYYRSVTECRDSPLQQEARRRLTIIDQINTVLQKETNPQTLEGLLVIYEQQIYGMGQLLKTIEDPEYKPILFLLREQAELEYALLLKEHYSLLDDGIQKTIDAFKSLIKDNQESKRVWSHRMMLADFYYELAKYYTARQSPTSPEFSVERFKSMAEPARQLYYEISLADGYPEKLEAKSKLSAINSFINDIIEQAQ